MNCFNMNSGETAPKTPSKPIITEVETPKVGEKRSADEPASEKKEKKEKKQKKAKIEEPETPKDDEKKKKKKKKSSD
jgi:hypothetical protein